MRSAYARLISSLLSDPKPNAERMASNVVPSVPFRVIPRAMEALSGEMTTFGRSSTSRVSPRSSTPKSVEASMTADSTVVRGRGRASMGSPGSKGSLQPAMPRHAAATAPIHAGARRPSP